MTAPKIQQRAFIYSRLELVSCGLSWAPEVSAPLEVMACGHSEDISKLRSDGVLASLRPQILGRMLIMGILCIDGKPTDLFCM